MSQFTSQLSWAHLAWACNHCTWWESHWAEENHHYVKIKGFDHHKNKNQDVFVAILPNGNVIFRFGCISKMTFYSKSLCLGGLCNMRTQVPWKENVPLFPLAKHEGYSCGLGWEAWRKCQMFVTHCTEKLITFNKSWVDQFLPVKTHRKGKKRY